MYELLVQMCDRNSDNRPTGRPGSVIINGKFDHVIIQE